MNKYRMKFTKVDRMRFIGHLDMLKLFQRAIKRAKLPISYSKGFNPHQIISFAIPLSLGMASVGEYSDFQLDEKMPCDEIKERLNNAMPDGMEILEVRELPENAKNSAALVEAGLYEIIPDKEIENLDMVLKELLESKELLIERTSKRVTKEVNIRDDIFELEVIENDNVKTIKALIATGSKQNLKPELLIEYIYKKLGLDFDPVLIKSKRIEMYKRDNGKFVAL